MFHLKINKWINKQTKDMIAENGAREKRKEAKQNEGNNDSCLPQRDQKEENIFTENTWE